MKIIQNQHAYDGELRPVAPSPTHSWVDGQWVPDPAKASAQLEVTKTQALAQLHQLAQAQRTTAAGTTDPFEMAAWPTKLRIAQAILAKPATAAATTAATPQLALNFPQTAGTALSSNTNAATASDKAIVQAEIEARGLVGETLEGFCQKIVAKAEAFAQAIAGIDGARHQAQETVNAATTPQAVEDAVAAFKARFSPAANPVQST